MSRDKRFTMLGYQGGPIKLGQWLDQSRQADEEVTRIRSAFRAQGVQIIHDEIITADYSEIERRVFGAEARKLDQMEASHMVVVTFSATREEKMALLYGMSAVKRWDRFVSDETKARMRRRRRRNDAR